MNQINWSFLLLAIIAAACMVGTGIAIAQGSVFGIMASVFGIVAIMGLGFKKKKDMKGKGKL